jgi:DNA modification methylase
MPKKSTNNARQLSLEPKKPVPKMPDGYYSSGPNPNLRAFVEQHATPYDPATDTYDVPPFDKSITSTKATAIYNMHTYWSKKPHDAIREYIRHYTQPGDLVLDPFSGSGGTSLAALMEGRKAIAIDLSPAATFITKNYCTSIDVDELQRALEELQEKVKPEMDWLYETRCDRCDGKATTTYMVYSQVFRCERCLSEVPLFDCEEVDVTDTKGKIKTINACPICKAQGNIEEISTRSSEKVGAVPVLVSYQCEEGCKPTRSERRYNDYDKKKRDYFQKFDLGKIVEIDKTPVPHWTPKIPMIKGYETTVKRNLEKQGVHLVDDLFTKRSLWALAAINDFALKSGLDILRFAFTAIILNCSKMYRYRSNLKGGFQVGTYYLPQETQIINVWRSYIDKIHDFITGDKNWPNLSHNVIVSTQSATNLSTLSDSSLDYIFTDPPYSGTVQYGELNFVWEAWLGFDTHWHDQEIIVNETRGKTDEDWANAIRLAMYECYRVLKPGRWLSLCYHDTSEGTWQLIQDIMAEVGFVSEDIKNAIYIDTDQKSYNQVTAEKVTKRDLVINFRKPHPDEIMPGLVLTGDEDLTTFTEKAHAILHEALTAHPGSTGDRLYDEVVSRMVRKGTFERHNFEALLTGVAEVGSNGRWYLLDSADQTDAAEASREAKAMKTLETFAQGWLSAHPEAEGVHYSDLFERYLPIPKGDKPRRTLIDLLPEYYLKAPDGTWRLPSADEAEKLHVLRESGALRRIRRFANALVEGVAPADRDRPSNAATAGEWIRQCRRAGLYAQGRAIYESGGYSFSGLSEEMQLEIDEDYQICVRRS